LHAEPNGGFLLRSRQLAEKQLLRLRNRVAAGRSDLVSTREKKVADRAVNASMPNRRWRFSLVLIAAPLVSAGQPPFAVLLGDQASHDFSVAMLVMGVLLLPAERRNTIYACLATGSAAIATFCSAISIAGSSSSALTIASHRLTALLFALVLWDIIRTIRVSDSSTDAILAPVCGCLMLGIVWSLLYQSLQTALPGSFRLASEVGTAHSTPDLSRSDVACPRFVTLATVGCGDVLPPSRLARPLVWMDAIAGQSYLAELVAGLVGLPVSQGRFASRAKRTHEAAGSEPAPHYAQWIAFR
jgi:hypothetical protein